MHLLPIQNRMAHLISWIAAGLLFCHTLPTQGADQENRDNLARENLVAWCIVPFDAKSRGPAARAAMLNRLGLKRVAYDWREVHVPTFEQEILEYKKHGLEYFAFWSWHPQMIELVKKHNIHPQFWLMMPNPSDRLPEKKVESAAKALIPQVNQTRQMGCKLGLYNHGGWAGEPKNLAAVCLWLHQHADAGHVGIVYNFHHAHDHIDDFAESFAMVQPYLHCLNLNGMNRDARPLILPIGQGKFEKQMIKIVRDSGYKGPVGILDHRESIDAEESLRENLRGLARLRAELQ